MIRKLVPFVPSNRTLILLVFLNIIVLALTLTLKHRQAFVDNMIVVPSLLYVFMVFCAAYLGLGLIALPNSLKGDYDKENFKLSQLREAISENGGNVHP